MKWFQMKRCYDRHCKQCGAKMFIGEEIGRRYNPKSGHFNGDIYFHYSCDSCKLQEDIQVPERYLKQLMKDCHREIQAQNKWYPTE